MTGTISVMDTRSFLPKSGFVDLPKRMLDRYSLAELIRAAATDDGETLRFYNEVSEAVAQRTAQQPSTFRSYFIPNDYLARDLQATSGTGAYLVSTQNAGFAGAMFASSITARLPMRRAQLVGNGTVAAVTTPPTVAWLAGEGAEAPDAAPVFGQRAVTPRTVSTVQFVSRQLDLQSPGAVGFVEQTMGRAVAQAVDAAFVSGTGGAQPVGLLSMPDTVSQSGSSLAFAGVCTMIEAAEGLGGQPWVLMGKTTAKLLRQRPTTTGGGPIFAGGMVDGLSTIVSRAVPDAAMLIFDPTMLVEARWGSLEITVSPVTSSNAFRAGIIGVRVMATVDYVADHPGVIAKTVNVT